MRNLTMMTDLYQLTMMYGYYKCGMRDKRAAFDMFYRSKDESTHCAVMAGVEQLIDYICQPALRRRGHRLSALAEALRRGFPRPSCAQFSLPLATSDAVPEGTVVFPDEPLVRVVAPIFEAQLIETALLNIINHQTLIATKASRVVQAAEERRGAWSSDCAALRGPTRAFTARARPSSAAALGTSNVLTGQMYGVPIIGHPRPQLGHVLSQRAGGLPRLCRAVPHELPVAGGYLRHAAQRRAQRHHACSASCGQGAIEPKGIRLDSRRSGLSEPARRARCWTTRASRIPSSARPAIWTKTSSAT